MSQWSDKVKIKPAAAGVAAGKTFSFAEKFNFEHADAVAHVVVVLVLVVAIVRSAP